MSVSDISHSYQYSQGSGNVYLVATKMANSGGHAAPAVKADINWVYIKDTQNTNDGTPIMVHRKEVTDVFEANSVRADGRVRSESRN